MAKTKTAELPKPMKLYYRKDRSVYRVWTSHMGEYGQFDIYEQMDFMNLEGHCNRLGITLEQVDD